MYKSGKCPDINVCAQDVNMLDTKINNSLLNVSCNVSSGNSKVVEEKKVDSGTPQTSLPPPSLPEEDNTTLYTTLGALFVFILLVIIIVAIYGGSRSGVRYNYMYGYR
jgi:hypothetical protein